MNTLKIADAFDKPSIAPERLEQIVARLESFDAATIKSGPNYYQDTGGFAVRLSDATSKYSQKDPAHRPELTITEAELSAVQAHYAGKPEATKISAKLEEAVRRIDEARDYVAELRSRPAIEAPRRKLV